MTSATPASSSFPARTARPSDVSMRLRPSSAASGDASDTSTSNPERAATSAMPDPIRPQPITPTFVTVYLLVPPAPAPLLFTAPGFRRAWRAGWRGRPAPQCRSAGFGHPGGEERADGGDDA